MERLGFIKNNLESSSSSNIIPVDFRHAYVTGITGSGKTASVIRPNLKDRINKGHGIVFFDYKGHEHRYVKYFAKEANRLQDVVEIGKPTGTSINLLEELDTNKLIAFMKNSEKSQDTYWINTTSQWVVSTIGVANSLYDINKWISENTDFSAYKKTYDNSFTELLTKKISFETLYDIFDNIKTFKKFQMFIATMTDHLNRIKGDLFAHFEEHDMPPKEITSRVTLFYAKFEGFKKHSKFMKEKKLSQEASDASSGDNGVFQMVGNIIGAYAKTFFLNNSQSNLKEIINSNKILIIDTQGFDDTMIELFFDAINDQLFHRIKNKNHKDLIPISMFVDEAYRVINTGDEIRNDILREAEVELIFSFQNEEQFVEKIGGNKWLSLQRNFAHKYDMTQQHQLYCDDTLHTIENFEECLDDELNSAEADYNNIHRDFFTKTFLSDGVLPSQFVVNYIHQIFEKDQTVDVIDINTNESTCLQFVPAHIKQECFEDYLLYDNLLSSERTLSI
ncbi:type IV secretory system conjugative DNA transfer family protein [Sulfurimonas sp. NW15]|uniref:type IV secretory system conjugative DNA transfer family protein n=1 Tax=Sulfurimonas sp. NW15 TaxID=2922729 RepID=UPI003DA9A6DD